MLLWVVCAKAQPATVIVEAKMDSSVLWMGEQTAIHLSLTQDEGQQVYNCTGIFLRFIYLGFTGSLLLHRVL